MKKNFYLCFIVLLLAPLSLMCQKGVPLPEISRPAIFIVKYEKIYVLEKASVFVYSLKDYRLIKKFGKAGEGPQEFKINLSDGRPLSMSFFKENLIVNSMNKLSWFTNQGDFIREEKVKVDFLIFPVKNNYVGIGPLREEGQEQWLGFKLLDHKFDSLKILYKSDFALGRPREIILPVTTFTFNPVYKDNIYINSNSKEFVIDVFNAEGNKEYTIKKDYKVRPIPEKFKQDALEWFKISPRFKRMYEMIKKILVIRKHFPPIRDMQIRDDTIHVITYKRQNLRWECILLDLKGKELGRKFIPLETYAPFSFYPILYSSYQGKIYSLVDNEEDETWDVHITNLK